MAVEDGRLLKFGKFDKLQHLRSEEIVDLVWFGDVRCAVVILG